MLWAEYDDGSGTIDPRALEELLLRLDPPLGLGAYVDNKEVLRCATRHVPSARRACVRACLCVRVRVRAHVCAYCVQARVWLCVCDALWLVGRMQALHTHTLHLLCPPPPGFPPKHNLIMTSFPCSPGY